MLTPRHLALPPRHSRGGFTLVELLVVIGIIAILAAVALPGITGALKKAKENASMQTSVGLGLACITYANDNDQTFPGSLPNATPAVTVAASLDVFKQLAGSYISNTDTLYIAGAGGGKFVGTSPQTNLKATNISWDYTVQQTGTLGCTSNDPDQLPIIISTGSKITYGASGAAAAATAIISDSTKNPFGNDGVAEANKDGTAKFYSDVNGTGVAFPISSASLIPATTYAQMTPSGT